MKYQFALEAVLAVASFLGIAVGWLPGNRGNRRIRAPFGAIVSNVGVLIIVAPWIVIPLLAQPRFVGGLRVGTLVAGIVLVASFVALTVWGTPFIASAAKKGGDELNPEFLAVKGPYQWIRHPQYAAAIAGLLGFALLMGGIYALILNPLCYLLFRFEAHMEESRVLGPKFGNEFRHFKARVPAALYGRVGTAILVLLYVVFDCLVVLGKIPNAM